jgi:hypothetical protein
LIAGVGNYAQPVAFDPYKPPEFGETGRKAQRLAIRPGYAQDIRSYQDVKVPYEGATIAIRQLLAAYPMVYAITRAGKSEATGQFATTKDPAAARAQLGGALRKLLDDIEATEKRIGRDLDPLDLQPIHRQLFDGKPASSKVDWTRSFPQYLAKEQVKDHDFGKALALMGLEYASQAAFFLAPFTGGASLAVLLAIGVGAAGAKAAMTEAQYEALSQASKTAVTKGTELVSTEQVDEARALADAARAEAILAALNAAAIGVGSVARYSAARAAAAGEEAPGAATAVSKMLDVIDDVQAFESMVDAMVELGSAAEKAIIGYDLFQASAPAANPSAAGVVQRAANYGKDFEAHVDAQIWAGTLDPGIPQMHVVIPGAHNHLDNGIDRIGIRFEKGKVEIYHFEMKYRLRAEPGAPQPSAELSRNPRSGVLQSGGAWTADAVEKLCNSNAKEAMVARDALRAHIAEHRGVPITHISHDEVKRVLRANLNPNSFVVVPAHVSARRIFRQIAGLVRQGRKIRGVRTSAP